MRHPLQKVVVQDERDSTLTELCAYCCRYPKISINMCKEQIFIKKANKQTNKQKKQLILNAKQWFTFRRILYK